MEPRLRWSVHLRLAQVARAGIVLAPTLLALGAALLAARMLPADSATAAQLLVPSVAALIAAYLGVWATRWLSPLSFLLRLDLLFPDELPSRFRVALAAGTTKRLTAPTSGGMQEQAAYVVTLAARLAAHDGRTRGHSERVRAYVDLIGKEMGLATKDADRLRWAALLHDIGKVDVDVLILNNPSRLDEPMWKIIRRHPEVGGQLVAPLAEFLGPWIDTVIDHHEWVDGSGYPAGKIGEEISLGGRITSVADAYDVMTAAGRVYRAPKTPEEARKELAICVGSQFDRQVVRAFLQIPHTSLRRRSLFAAAAATGITASTQALTAATAHELPGVASPPDGAALPDGVGGLYLDEGALAPGGSDLD